MKTASQCDNIERAGVTVTAVINPASSDFAHQAAHMKCCNKTSTEEKKLLVWLGFSSQPGWGVWSGDKERSLNAVAERKCPCLYFTPGGSGALACLSELPSQNNQVSLSLILQTIFDPIGGFFTVNQTAPSLVKDF